jgi:hypothetical protein
VAGAYRAGRGRRQGVIMTSIGRDAGAALPVDVIELTEVAVGPAAHALGYYRDERFVIFGYCPGGGEVVWKDGHSSGFATGGWRTFLNDIVPLALRYGVDLGSLDRVGTHVLLIDRQGGVAFAIERTPAEQFLCRLYGLPPAAHPCLCGRRPCARRPTACGCTRPKQAETESPGPDNRTAVCAADEMPPSRTAAASAEVCRAG